MSRSYYHLKHAVRIRGGGVQAHAGRASFAVPRPTRVLALHVGTNPRVTKQAVPYLGLAAQEPRVNVRGQRQQDKKRRQDVAASMLCLNMALSPTPSLMLPVSDVA